MTRRPIHCLREPRQRQVSRKPFAAGVLLSTFLFCCLTGLGVSAQEPPRFGERIDVEVVDLDVFVTDPSGAPVSDLQAGDFTVLVNGTRAEIVDFAAHFPAAPLPGREAPARPATAPRETAQGASSEHEDPRTLLVFVDMLRAGTFRRMTAMRAVQDFIHASMRSGDRAMVAFFDNVALRVLQPLTDDKDAVSKTLKALSSRSVPSHSDFVGFQLDEEDLFRLERAAMRALQDFVGVASGARERPVLLLVGGGYRLQGWENVERAARLQEDYEQLRDVLAASGLTLHSVWAADNEGAVGADMPSVREPAIDGPAPASAPLAMGSTISTLADDTGGSTFVATAGLNSRLERAERQREGYYSLAFRSPDRSPGRRLTIRVSVAREGVRVWHRRLLRTSTDSETSRQTSMAALLTDRPANPWSIGVDVGRIHRDRLRRFRAPLEIRVPVDHVLFLEREKRHFARLQFFLSVRDARGNYTSADPKELVLQLTDSEVAALRKDGLRYALELVVSPGTTDVALTVADVIARTQSTTRFAIATNRR